MKSASVHPILDAVPTTQHNDVALQQEQRLRNWQLTTWWVLCLATILVTTNCLQWLTRKEHYVLLQLDGFGVSRYVQEMDAEAAHAMPVRMLVVQNFIRGIRTVSIDQRFQDHSMNPAYFMCREKAQAFLREYFSRPENDPKTLQKKGISKVPIDIQVAPQTEETFRVMWTEEIQEITGTIRQRWDATVTLELKDPGKLDSKERQYSPLGLFVNYVNFNFLGKI